MNVIPRTYAALMACVCFSLTQVAIAEDVSSSIVEEKIRTLVPNAKTIAISETPVDNVLQVQINSADEQISFSPEKAEYNLLVFTDLDCGYCRKLHNQMEEYNEEGIAIHYLAFPRAGVGSESYDKFVSVWCADDQREALTLAKNGDDPEPQKCPNPIADQYELGREVGVTGTPALVTADGTLIPCYMPPKQLRQRLESLQASAE